MLKHLHRIFSTHKIINVLISSYAIMLLIPFIASMISFGIGNNIIKDYVSDTATSYAKNFSDKFDRVIYDCYFTQNQLYFDEQIKQLCDDINKNDDVFAMKTLSTKLKSLLLSNENISEIVIFPFDSDYVIHSSGFFYKSEYFNAYTDKMEKDLFDKTTSYKGDSYFCTFPVSDTFALSANLPVTSNVSPARVFILSDAKKVLRNNLPKTDSFFVFQNEQLLINSDSDNKESSLSLIETMSHKNISAYTENNIFATTINSSVCELKYFYITDLHAISSSQNTYIFISLGLFIIALLLGIILFKLFIEIQYNPINNIIQYIKSHINSNNDVDSFEFINMGLNNLEKEILQQKEMYLDQNNLLLSMQLSQWLKYNKIPNNPEKIVALNKDCIYLVASITFDSPEELFFEHNTEGIEQNISISKFIIENILSEMLDNTTLSNKIIEFENSIVSIITFRENYDYKNKLNKVFQDISSTVRKHFNLSLNYFCSSTYNSYEMLHQAFTESAVLLYHEEHAGECHFYDDIDFSNDSINMQLTHCYKRLYTHIINGDYEQSKTTIKNACAFTGTDLSTPHARYILTRIISSMNDAFMAITSIESPKIQEFIQHYAPIDIIMNSDNASNPISALNKYCKSICKFINENKEKPLSVSKKAEEYILQNYSNSQLTSDSVAINIGLSRDYFLKLFKQQTGQSMSDYLNKIRIEKACEIIKSEKCSLNDVAHRVGYTNTKTFTRAFIKHVGITPGKYNM